MRRTRADETALAPEITRQLVEDYLQRERSGTPRASRLDQLTERAKLAVRDRTRAVILAYDAGHVRPGDHAPRRP